MSANLYILSGASGCGKTTLLNSLAAPGEGNMDAETRAISAPKYSERAARTLSLDLDDIVHVPEVQLGPFDIAYVMNNVKYGIKLQPIRDLLAKGYNPFIIVSDFRVVRQLKEVFRNQSQALYISSAIDSDRLRRLQKERLGFSPSEEQKRVLAYHFARMGAATRLGWWDRVSDCMTELESDWRAYATDARSTEIRAQKIRAFHVRYIEHISLFDHVILNYSEDKSTEMTEQARWLIRTIDKYKKFNTKKYPPLFIVAAASGAGKGTLMETLHLIGRDRVRITSKLAKRTHKLEDRRDGMIALFRKPQDPEAQWPEWWTTEMQDYGNRGEFPQEYDLQWKFHFGTEYAASRKEIQDNIDRGFPQILVSNMDQFEMFRTLWPSHAVFIYLHRLISAYEHREFQMRKWKGERSEAEARIAEKQAVHEAYINKIAQFDHVLLNTAYQEDLFDQMFRLLEFYGGLVFR